MFNKWLYIQDYRDECDGSKYIRIWFMCMYFCFKYRDAVY